MEDVNQPNLKRQKKSTEMYSNRWTHKLWSTLYNIRKVSNLTTWIRHVITIRAGRWRCISTLPILTLRGKKASNFPLGSTGSTEGSGKSNRSWPVQLSCVHRRKESYNSMRWSMWSHTNLCGKWCITKESVGIIFTNHSIQEKIRSHPSPHDIPCMDFHLKFTAVLDAEEQ